MEQITKREVKFKFVFTDKKSKEFTIGPAYTLEDIIDKSFVELIADAYSLDPFNPRVLDIQMFDKIQYIGEIDTAGVEIYENFIVDAPHYEKMSGGKVSIKKCQVIFDSQGFILKRLSKGDKFRWIPNFDECTIVGNIYQSPHNGK
jgi:hypothetical protein